MAAQVMDALSPLPAAVITISIHQASRLRLNIQDRPSPASNTDDNNSDFIRMVQEYIGSGGST